MDMELRGKTVVITGGSKGIGLACAEAFAAEGCDLLLSARDPAVLDTAAASLRARFQVGVRVPGNSRQGRHRDSRGTDLCTLCRSQSDAPESICESSK